MYYTTWDMQDSPISAANGNDINHSTAVAPFVMKTYQMVTDPATDHLISWSRSNNSFIVVDPLQFSRLILPSNFKHSNFSSFIRQLNTYGFRKVDPDRWEFANEWFLRGQKHLLKNIIRRKHSPTVQISEQHHQMQDEEMDREIERMRKEQEEMEMEIQGMTKRLETTERRPDQMIEFLCKVVEDPDILPKMILERERKTRQRQICSGDGLGDKKRRLIFTPPSSLGAATNSNSDRTTEDEEGSNSLGMATTSSSPEVELICQSSINETCCEAWFRPIGTTASTAGYGDEISGYVGFDCDAPVVELEAEVPPYPFSLLGGGF